MTISKPLRRLLPALMLAAMLSTLWTSLTAAGQAVDSVGIGLPGDFEKSHFLVTDLNGDDRQEILIANRTGTLYLIDGASYQVVWSDNVGVFLPKYDRTNMDAGIAAADLDQDGQVEIVLALGGVDPITREGPGAVVVVNYVGAPAYFRVAPGWPRYAYDELGESSARPDGTPDGFVASPSLGDIDGDGDLEVVIGGMDRRIHAWHHDGAYVLGWPMDRDDLHYRDTRSTAALADMDGDGVMEVIIGTNNYPRPACPNPYLFYVLEGDATFMPGFPYETAQNIESSPAVGDIDGDGYPDIVFGTGDYSESCGQPADGHLVHAIDRFGQPLPGWPQRTDDNMLNSPALGDLDQDGLPEVVIHNGKTLYAWHGDGSRVSGFPVAGTFVTRHQSAVIADVLGDNAPEILVSSGDVYAATGARVQTHPYSWTSLVVTDQDADGLLETIGVTYRYGAGSVPGNNRQIEIIQHFGDADTEQPWPMFHRSLDRRGTLEFSATIAGRVVDRKGTGVGGVSVSLNGSMTLVTDGTGYYSTDGLLPGTYSVRPSHTDYVFSPSDYSVTVPPNGTELDFVMAPATYSVQGSVRLANDLPLAGVQVRLSTGAKTATDKLGMFRFDGLTKGTYDVELNLSDSLRSAPQSASLSLPGDGSVLFYALPAPVVEDLSPLNPTPVTYVDPQGLETTVVFPPDDVGLEQVMVMAEVPEDIFGFLATGHTLFVAPGDDPGGAGGAPDLSAKAPAIELEVQYSDADLRDILEPADLTLLWLSTEGWVEAASTCAGESSVTHDYVNRTVRVTVCAWGTYSLVGPAYFLNLPMLMDSADGP